MSTQPCGRGDLYHDAELPRNADKAQYRESVLLSRSWCDTVDQVSTAVCSESQR